MKFRVLHGFHAQKDSQGATRMYGPNEVVDSPTDLCAKFNAGPGASKFEALDDQAKASHGKILEGRGGTVPREAPPAAAPPPSHPGREASPSSTTTISSGGQAHTVHGPPDGAAVPPGDQGAASLPKGSNVESGPAGRKGK